MHFLDCTIRDGGYVNNWNFSKNFVRNLYITLLKCKYHYIELGFRDNLNSYNDKLVSLWRKSTDKIIKETIEDIYNDDTKIAVMVNYGSSSLEDFYPKETSLVSMVRVAFHKNDLENAIQYINDIKKLGYTVCANAMGTINYSEEEIEILCKEIIKYEIDYLYIADSYGSINDIQLKDKVKLIKNTFHNLNHNFKYKLGFHAHNNTQRALANVISCKNDFDIIDSTMYGMGRGAGNLSTELIISEYCINNKYFNDKNVYDCVSFIYNNLLINELQFENLWGYDLIYFVSGHLNIHPNYAMKIKEYKINDIDIIWDALYKISKSDKAFKFYKSFLDEILTN